MATGGLSKGNGRRQKKLANYYKTQALKTDRNRERNMNRHLRSHPADRQTAERYGTERAKGVKLNTKGRKRAARSAA